MRPQHCRGGGREGRKEHSDFNFHLQSRWFALNRRDTLSEDVVWPPSSASHLMAGIAASTPHPKHGAEVHLLRPAAPPWYEKPSTAHRPLIDRLSTAHRPLVKKHIDRFSRSKNLRAGLQPPFSIQEERSMCFLPAVDERSMSGQ